MKIGLLECDHVLDEFRLIAGDYREMFATLFPSLDFQCFDVCRGQFPASAEACDAYICTGSKYSVYEPVDWIQELQSFVRAIHAGGQGYIGVCFGHQMLAEALGGKVEKAAQGWNVGLHRFEMQRREAWMEPFQPEVKVLMMCQDQVMRLPEGSVVLASAPTCPVAMFRTGERMLGIQGHPEFPHEYEAALMQSRRARIGDEKVDAGLESLQSPPDQVLLASWVLKFLNNPKPI